MKSVDKVMADPKRLASLVRRFWPKVDRSGGPDACWPWTAKAKHPYGYGRMNSGRGIDLKAHQIAFALAYGPIGKAWIRHACDNPVCCNPAHLVAGTAKDNTQDAIKRGRWKNPPRHIGEAHPRVTLTIDQARDIASDTRSAKVLAAEYNVSTQTIYRIRWKKDRFTQLEVLP